MKRSFYSNLLLSTIALTAVALCPLRAASAPALSFTGGSGLVGNGDANVGWTFTLNTSMNVTSLGYYDDGADGLQTAHPVGIFSSAGTLLVSATVPAGTNAALTGGFRYVSIGTFTLGPGTYIIDASITANNDPFYASASSISTLTGITYVEGRAGGGTGLVLPSGNPYPFTNGYFGPNFQVSAVPEPSTWALMGMGAGVLAFAVARRRSVQVR